MERFIKSVMKNILLIAPHPDDEIVGAFMIIKKILKGKRVIVFFLTNGIINKNTLWFWQRNKYEEKVIKRKKEMNLSMRLLKIKKFYLQDISTRSLKDNIERTYKKILQLKKKHDIDTIFCPAYEGGHQDHDVANFICSRLANKCKIFEFAEYNYFKKKIYSNHFFLSSKKDHVIYLTDKEKREKKNFLKIYKSEQQNLNYISVEQESYRELIKYNYKTPPHKGTLFYRRFSFFGWHPRVDSDHPSLICKKIIDSKIF
jgi:LmbE family N-acetylglucosaminyl deacetylase